MKPAKDLSGQKIGRLLVLCLTPGKYKHVCLCQCGKYCEISSGSLIKQLTQSCGCLHREKATARKYKHGQAFTTESKTLFKMRGRCENPDNPKYPVYGARGIKVCDRWKESVLNFIEDMGRKPSEDHSIERVDNDGDYCPENCIWATAKIQARNRSSNILLTYNGETKIIVVWSELTGLPASVIRKRFHRGWPTEKILESPVRGRGK